MDMDVGRRFFNEEIANRTKNAYIWYNGRIKYVGNLRGYQADLFDPGADDKFLTVNIQTDPLVDLTSPELGFLNQKVGHCVYVIRKPARQWHYLFEMNCQYITLTGQTAGCPRGMFYTPEFADMIHGEYPTYRKVMKEISGRAFEASRAFHRYFAVMSRNKELTLFYRDEAIADWNKQDKLWILKPQFESPTLVDLLEQQGLELGY